MNTSLWQFAEVESIYARLKPLTPYGRRAFERRELLTDIDRLNARYDRIDAMLALASANPLAADRVRFHLRRIPLLPPIDTIASTADLFLVKKFLANFKAISAILSDGIWMSEPLFTSLLTGNNDAEIFFLTDAANADLARIRTEIRAVDANLQQIRASRVSALVERFSLDFGEREFLVINSERAAALPAGEIFLEPFDSRHVVARPVLPAPYFEHVSRRDHLISREQEIEARIIADLAETVRKEASSLRVYEREVESLDVAMASAELATSLELTRPNLAPPNTAIDIEAGRLIPLQHACLDQGLAYHPLTVRLDQPHALLHGSNMSGKSVVLKTVASLQLLAQLGLFVPAERFTTVVFDQMHFIGAIGSEEARGLSSFGHEMVALHEALQSPGQAKLLIIDEFARTTTSHEAAALIAGLLSHLNDADDICSLLATHYASLPSFERVQTWRMKGIDWGELHRLLESSAPNDLSARIRAINASVPHQIVADDGEERSRDAIGIAELLGLEESIIAFARQQLRSHQETSCRT